MKVFNLLSFDFCIFDDGADDGDDLAVILIFSNILALHYQILTEKTERDMIFSNDLVSKSSLL